MKKLLKYAPAALAGALVLIFLLLAAIAATFDPNLYKPRFAAWVKENTHRQLDLQGEVRLVLFPRLGLDFGRATLGEYDSATPFASVESAHIELAWWPLLKGEIVAGKLTVDGLRLRLVRRKDGSTNFDDLLRPQSGQTKFDIAGLRLTGEAVFADEAAGRVVTVKGLELETGRLADRLPAQITTRFSLNSDKPRLNASIETSAGLTFDRTGKRVSLRKTVIAAKGQTENWSDLEMKLAGNIETDFLAGRWTVDGARLALAGRSGENRFDAALDAPRLRLEKSTLSGEPLALTAGMRRPGGDFRARLTLSRPTGRGEPAYTGEAELELEGRQGESTLQGRISGPAAVDLRAQRLNLPQLVASLSLGRADRPGKEAQASLAGTASIDFANAAARLVTAGQFDGSRMKVVWGMNGFSAPRHAFELDIERLDLDRYLPAAAPEKRKPTDFSALNRLAADGRVRIGELIMGGTRFRNVRLGTAQTD